MTDQLDQFLASKSNVHTNVNTTIVFFGEERETVRKDAVLFGADSTHLPLCLLITDTRDQLPQAPAARTFSPSWTMMSQHKPFLQVVAFFFRHLINELVYLSHSYCLCIFGTEIFFSFSCALKDLCRTLQLSQVSTLVKYMATGSSTASRASGYFKNDTDYLSLTS